MAGLEVHGTLPRSATVAPGKGGSFASIGVSLRLCRGAGGAGWQADLCALLEESGLRGVGDGISEPSTSWRWWLAPGLGLQGGLRVAGPLWWEGGLEMLLAPRQYSFSIEGQGEVYRTPRLGGRARVGLGLHF
jgi:hypothetical protein